MRRFHLFEWEDQPWLPIVFRNFITDHLCHLLTQKMRKSVNQGVAERLKPLLVSAGSKKIIDLCSGAGGPLLKIRRILAEDLGNPIEVVLTDLYPNVDAFKQREAEGEGAVKACYESTSAFDVPSDLHGLRTLFSALHHFKPEDARRLLTDVVRKRQRIAVIEPLERTTRMLLLMVLYVAWQSFVWTPFVGKMSLQRFLMTYVIPLGPAVILWDGLVSVLRTYTPEELLGLADSVGATDYKWEVGRFDMPGPFGVLMPTTYLIGFSTSAA
jgi:hypothetical protein